MNFEHELTDVDANCRGEFIAGIVVKLTHTATQAGAVRAINRMQTMRNWVVGYYIAEFELK